MPVAPAILRRGPLAGLLLLAACSSAPEREDPAAAAVDLNAARASADAAYEAGEWREAETHYAALLRAAPQEAGYWFRMGNIYARTERPDQAVQAYREALVRDANNAKAWFNMGVVQLRQAANSFGQMQLHLDETDPIARQGEKAYAGIMAILGEPRRPAPSATGDVTEADTQASAASTEAAAVDADADGVTGAAEQVSAPAVDGGADAPE
ncbi:MAG: tetratricopeptide repeat protein [Gammaproteobacteria bacterium]